LVGDHVCLMGNVPPRDVLAGSSPEDVQKAAIECIRSNGESKGLLLSAGGGVSPGTTSENIKALAQAVRVAR
jgi:uroporphyrinogen decarboxylase